MARNPTPDEINIATQLKAQHALGDARAAVEALESGDLDKGYILLRLAAQTLYDIDRREITT